MLDIHDLARELKVSESWLYFQVSAKGIPFTRLGRSIRFDPIEIKKWLEIKRIGVSE